jgi:hypothetical protein
MRWTIGRLAPLAEAQPAHMRGWRMSTAALGTSRKLVSRNEILQQELHLHHDLM